MTEFKNELPLHQWLLQLSSSSRQLCLLAEKKKKNQNYKWSLLTFVKKEIAKKKFQCVSKSKCSGSRGHAHGDWVLTSELMVAFCVLSSREDTKTEPLYFWTFLMSDTTVQYNLCAYPVYNFKNDENDLRKQIKQKYSLPLRREPKKELLNCNFFLTL